jgi:multicomponent Na+:H+ antiporter subunit D
VICLGVTSALLGALLALVQDDLKRLLAWDTVSQTGVLITGFASHTTDGVTSAAWTVVARCQMCIASGEPHCDQSWSD